MITARTGKGYYTETEVARELGISLDDLRTLVRRHILPESEEDMANLPITSFQPSDVLLLRLLVTGGAVPITVG
jgi:hypothetical protein